jgi:hypothetical protein
VDDAQGLCRPFLQPGDACTDDRECGGAGDLGAWCDQGFCTAPGVCIE